METFIFDMRQIKDNNIAAERLYQFHNLVIEATKGDIPKILFKKPFLTLSKISEYPLETSATTIIFEYTFCTSAFTAKLYIDLIKIKPHEHIEDELFSEFTIINVLD